MLVPRSEVNPRVGKSSREKEMGEREKEGECLQNDEWIINCWLDVWAPAPLGSVYGAYAVLQTWEVMVITVIATLINNGWL